uniref:50S ribosomal protein L27 n=1 Tax=Candidatus Karelsulcia muelleri TaxID=336810 RepID=UPI0032B26394
MAHKKGVGSSRNGRDSIGKRLGVKLFGGQIAKPGSIIIRQRGTKHHPKKNVYMGKDYSIHSLIYGKVFFEKKKKKKSFISVIPIL